jgi:hypothetical protein
MKNKEIWKPIPNFSRYEASNKGRLRSLNYKRSGKTQVLKPAASNDGYLKTVLLNNEGVYKSWTVHLFVCLAFYGDKPKGLEINHMDGVKTNNSINNLEYCTHQENVKHSFNMGLQKPKTGELNGMSKLTYENVKEIRIAKKNGGRYWGRNELAIKFNVTAKHIQDIANNSKLWESVLI